MYYDTALIEKWSGKVLATYKGVKPNVNEALKALVKRARGIVEPEAYRALEQKVNGKEVSRPEYLTRFSYAVVEATVKDLW